MTQQYQDPTTSSPGQLWHDTMRARAALEQVRRRYALRRDGTSAIDAARRDLVEALEAYVVRLGADGTPVPYRLRDELRLHSALVGIQRR